MKSRRRCRGPAGKGMSSRSHSEQEGFPGQDGPSRPGNCLSLPESPAAARGRSRVETSSPGLCLSLSVSLPTSWAGGAAGDPPFRV